MKGKKIECTKCGEEFTMSTANFFKSYSPLHESNGLVPICKACVKNIFNEFIDKGKTPKEAIIELCKMLDKPFIDEEYTNVINNKKGQDLDCDDVGIFFKHVHMMQWRRQGICRYEHSIFQKEIIQNKTDNITKEEKIENKIERLLKEEDKSLDELEDKWGFGYSSEELVLFEKKYNKLKNNYNEKTEMHTEALLTYIRYSVKAELATAQGKTKEAKDWGALAKDAATAAKINPSQLSKADLTDGLSTFSELSQAIEKEVDIIPILPRFKCRPNDALDFNIWCYVNYIRHLQGLPACEYEDVYKFYDQRVEDYVKQYGDPYGIFTDDTSKKNRENIKKFIKDDGNSK